jgi:hypothetical protein
VTTWSDRLKSATPLAILILVGWLIYAHFNPPHAPAPTPAPTSFDFRNNGQQSGAELLRAFGTALKQAAKAANLPGADPNAVKNAMVNVHSTLRSRAFDSRFQSPLDAILPPTKDSSALTPAQISAWAKALDDIGDGINDAAKAVEAVK